MNGNRENEIIFFFNGMYAKVGKKLNCKVFENGKILDFDKKFGREFNFSVFEYSLLLRLFLRWILEIKIFSKSEWKR